MEDKINRTENHVRNALLRYGYSLEVDNGGIKIVEADKNPISRSQNYYIAFFIIIAFALIMTLQVVGFAFTIVGALIFLGRDIMSKIVNTNLHRSQINELNISSTDLKIKTKNDGDFNFELQDIEKIYFKLSYESNPFKSIFYAELEEEIYEIFKLISDHRSELDTDSKLLNKYLNIRADKLIVD